MQTLRLTINLKEGQEDRLAQTRDHVGRVVNGALKEARRQPQTQPEDLIRRHEAGAPLPPATRRALAAELSRARHWTRGGLKVDSFWLGDRNLQLDVRAEVVTIWTLTGRLELSLKLGNYQRHLLRRVRRVHGGLLTRGRSGDWYVTLYYEGDGTDAAQSIPDEVTRWEREGRFAEVVQALQTSPPVDAAQMGRLGLALLELGRTDEAELHLLRATAQAPDARVHLGLSLLSGSRNDPNSRLEHAELGLLAGPDDFTRWWLQGSQARALVELGRLDEARACTEHLIGEVPLSEIRSRARALYFAQGVYAALDDFESQERYAREALRLFELVGVSGEGLALKLDLAYRRFYQSRLDESRQLLTEAIDAAEQQGSHRAAMAHLIAAEFDLLTEHYERAVEHAKAAHLAQKRHASDRLDLVLRAVTAEARWRSDRVSAEEFEIAVEALRPTQAFDAVVIAFYRGLIAFGHGQSDRARAEFGAVLEGVALMDGFRLRAHAYLAALRWDAGEALEDAAAGLTGALDRIGGEWALGIDAERLAPLYAECARAGIGGGRIKRLAQRGQPVLNVRTLGHPGTDVNGQPVHIRLAKARELLVYLILHGAASRQELINALWDGQDRTELASYFKQVVLSLRLALRAHVPPDHDPVPLLGGRYSLTSRLRVRLDAAELERALQQPEVGSLQLALNSYQGPFLPEVDSEWVLFHRDGYETAAVTAAMLLGELLEARDPMRAATAYRRATEINPLFESAWSAAVRAYGRAEQPRLAEHLRRRHAAVFADMFEIGEEEAGMG